MLYVYTIRNAASKWEGHFIYDESVVYAWCFHS